MGVPLTWYIISFKNFQYNYDEFELKHNHLVYMYWDFYFIEEISSILDSICHHNKNIKGKNLFQMSLSYILLVGQQ